MRGAKVIIAARSQERAERAIAELKALPGIAEDKLEYLPLDLTSFDSIRNFATLFLDKKLPLHLLINNAGVMANNWGLTAEGFEMQFGTNHLGHFLLTSLLIDKLKESAPSRVVSLSSEGHKLGDDSVLKLVREEKDYAPWKVYGNSKLANILFASELNARLAGSGVIAASLHPGVIHTDLGSDSKMLKLFWAVSWPFAKSIPQGAATTCYVATASSPEEIAGRYFANSAVAEPSAWAKNADLAERLWTLSEQLTGISFLPKPAAGNPVASSSSSSSPL